MHYGKIAYGTTLFFHLNTHNPATGAAQNADSLPFFRIYKDNNGTPIITGSFALLDSGNTTGFYVASVALTGPNGFEPGQAYGIYCTATVGGIVGTLTHNFDCVHPAEILGTDTLQVGEITAVNSNVDYDTDLTIDDEQVDGQLFVFHTGNAIGQCKFINDSLALNGKIVLDDPPTQLPAIGDLFAILAHRKGAES